MITLPRCERGFANLSFVLYRTDVEKKNQILSMEVDGSSSFKPLTASELALEVVCMMHDLCKTLNDQMISCCSAYYFKMTWSTSE